MTLSKQDSTVFKIPLKPIYLCADSQLLFWRENDHLFLNSIRSLIESKTPTAAYLGASNGHNADFYHLFQAAMESLEIHHCRMIFSGSSPEDAAFLDEADIILLAGGEIERGWNEFASNGLKELILKRYYEGAILIGISAGAVQLGLYGWDEKEPTDHLFDTFQLVPFVVSAHEEEEWPKLKKALQLAGRCVQGIGIAAGGGLIYHPDNTVEPVRKPLCELTMNDNLIVQNVLFPNTCSVSEAPLEC